MKVKRILVVASCFCLMLLANQTYALTVQQFKAVCLSQEADCGEHPILTAYVGGALDLVASLQEQTEYLKKLYCKEPEELFDIKKIIQFIEQSAPKHDNKNAMLRLIAFLEKQGGC